MGNNQILTSKHITALAFYVNETGDVTEKIFTGKGLGSMASGRLQFSPAIQSAKKNNAAVEIFSLHSDHPSDFQSLKKSDICLIGKMAANTNALVHSMILANLAAVARLKNTGSTIALQYCDNYLDSKGPLKNFYEDLFDMSDIIIFPSNSLFNISKKRINDRHQVHIIKDPWQVRQWNEFNSLKSEGSHSIKLIWFGSNKNIPYLINSIPQLVTESKSSLNYELTILGQEYGLKEFKKFFPSFPQRSNWTFRLVPWNNSNQPEQLEKEIARAHISIIPSDPTDPLKTGVSHNRLVDSIRGGCVAIASPMRSYVELEELALLGDNFGELLNNAVKNYEDIVSKTRSARIKSLREFSPEINEKHWDNFWTSAIKSRNDLK